MGYLPRWIYKWIIRHRELEEDIPWAQDRSKRPWSNSRRVSDEVIEAIKLVRLRLYNQGSYCGA